MNTTKYFKRQVQETPKSLINDDGSCNYGTFNKPFSEFNFYKFKKPFFPMILKRQRLTEWEAVEILHEDFFLIAAVFKNPPVNINLIQFYDIKNNKLYDFGSKSVLSCKSQIASNLIKGNEYYRKSQTDELQITNTLDQGFTIIKGNSCKEGNNIEFDIKLEKCANPSIVCMPLTKTNPLYTEKDLLIPYGVIKFNNQEIKLNDSHISIIDDHRGYYPFKSGYDWVTTLYDIKYKGVISKFGLNLTSFYKCDNPEKYNENGYWLNGEYHTLPKVSFIREGNNWSITDDFGLVNLTFEQLNHHNIYKNMILFKLDYVLAFGTLSGSVITDDGTEIIIDKKFALGEKRYTKL